MADADKGVTVSPYVDDGTRKSSRAIAWRRVFKYQTWGALVVLLVAAIVTGVAHYIKEPNVRPIKTSDPTISLPMKPSDTVPMAAAAAYPFVALIITIAAIEFGVMYRKQSLTASVHAFIHILFMAIVGFAVVLAVTEATKPVAARFRPDYISRCKPVVERNEASGPLAAVADTRPVNCDPKVDPAVIDDGRKSFPSGHSSNTLSVCWYCLLYMCHALYYRNGHAYMGGLWAQSDRSCGKRVLMEVLQGLFIVWGCVVMCIAWWVGVSRYQDHRHNIDDILGGFMAALLWMTPISLISIGQLNFYHQRIAAAEEAEDLCLPTTQTLRKHTASSSPETTSPTSGAAAIVNGTSSGGTPGTVAAANCEPASLSASNVQHFTQQQREAWYDAKSSVYTDADLPPSATAATPAAAATQQLQ